MGITNLNKLLKRNAPTSKISIPLVRFAGSRIAIDATGEAYRYMSRSNKNNISTHSIRLDPTNGIDNEKRDTEWYGHYIFMAKTFASFGIVPIFVFDGKSIPQKEATKEGRRADKKVMIDRARELEKELKSIPISQRPDDKINELGRLRKNILFVNSELVSNIKSILNNLGFPVISALGEGEKTCASLAIEGKVSAVFSSDTDCIALGAPLTLTGYTGWGDKMAFDCVVYDRVLKELDLKPKEFLDLCIMSGTDFSRNIRGYGIFKIYNIMKQIPPDLEKSIENILPLLQEDKITEDALKALNYEDCRSTEIFGFTFSNLTIDPDFHRRLPKLDIDTKAIQDPLIMDRLESMGIGDVYVPVKAALRNFSPNYNYHGGSEKVLKEGRTIHHGGKPRFVVIKGEIPLRRSPDRDSVYVPPHQRVNVSEETKPDLSIIHKKRPENPTIFQ